MLNFENATTPGKFFGDLFSINIIAHLTHLYQPDMTLATHLALKDIYEQVIDLADGLVEKYQGVHGRVSIVVPQNTNTTKPLEFVKSYYDKIQTGRIIFKESFIQNIIDEISAVLAEGIYKLTYVK